MKKLLIVLAVLILLVGGCSALLAIGADEASNDNETETTEGGDNNDDGENEPLSMSTNEEFPPAEDVTITECGMGEFDLPKITLEVTNQSPKASSYSIEVQLQNADGTVVGEAIASVSGLRPDQTAIEDAASLDNLDAGFTCHLNSVDRFSDEG